MVTITTIDKAIKELEELAKVNKEIFDTHRIHITVNGLDNDVILDDLYDYNTKLIEKRLAAYKECANNYRQVADWLSFFRR